jgi:23S rRNA (guanosine2251-2'-O)-methyltransferase
MRNYVILHNIRSAYNVGSAFRTADGAGVSKIFLTGYTPSPMDRFGREQKEILKTSLGATKTVPYETVSDIHEVLARLGAEGIDVIAVEQSPRAIQYKNFVRTKDTAFVFGNEVTGIEVDVLDAISHHIDIPMHGIKESLNVSVCVGIILFNVR